VDQLWAPWRMSYLNETEPAPGCIFCTKGREDRDEQNLIVHRSEYCFVILNLYPYNSGHLMVVPYVHTGDLTTLPADVGTNVFTTAQKAVNALTEAMHPTGFNLGLNQGEAAGAGIADHVHLHVVPRWHGDTNFMPVLADAKVMPELLTATAAKVRSAFQGQRSEP
jgi:ATP adenylyltransferase